MHSMDLRMLHTLEMTRQYLLVTIILGMVNAQ